jgi:cation diffusion facilitator CzcD-associated flavoprotein CzcO
MDILQKVTKNKKKIGIIGAGPAGVCAALRCMQCGHGVTVFEQAHTVGGTWVYTSDSNTHSSVYENLM